MFNFFRRKKTEEVVVETPVETIEPIVEPEVVPVVATAEVPLKPEGKAHWAIKK